MDEERESAWHRLIWWLRWRIARPLLRRCSWCGESLSYSDFEDGTNIGWGAWGCRGCTEYPDG